MGNNRVRYIDAAKGLGILLVMLGHSISRLGQPVNTFILSFHMPLFFFVAGLLFYSRNIEHENFILRPNLGQEELKRYE